MVYPDSHTASFSIILFLFLFYAERIFCAERSPALGQEVLGQGGAGAGGAGAGSAAVVSAVTRRTLCNLAVKTAHAAF